MSAAGSHLRIAEIFASIQGEGIWAGVPSTFVRVSGCNLRCSWCDTPYASWSPEGLVRLVSDVMAEVAALPPRHLVITGGEPMIFAGTEELAREAKAGGMTITVETAGTEYRSLPCDLMSISPKLSNSTPLGTDWESKHDRLRIQIDVLTALMQEYDYQLKFVVSPANARDLEEIDTILAALPPALPGRVLLMPEGRDREALWQSARQLVPICIERNWRLAPRLQIDLFGDTRGT
ncbi:MAG: 7-carboxy-7-deazaguanine synthase QueE [Thaumarchaeota archaeon]|nr:7-carboxy-7-deazaguanine synthase QueE [Nitrososphaerota archaeon]